MKRAHFPKLGNLTFRETLVVKRDRFSKQMRAFDFFRTFWSSNATRIFRNMWISKVFQFLMEVEIKHILGVGNIINISNPV